MDGEHAPFGDKDENKADNPASGDNAGENAGDAEKNVHEGMKKRREGVAAFTDEDII